MTAFELATFELRPFAYVERDCEKVAIGAAVRSALAQLNDAFAQAEARPAGALMARFAPAANGGVTVRLGYPFEKAAAGTLKAAGLGIGDTISGQALVAKHVGDHAQLRKTYDAMRAEIVGRGLTPAEVTWERYVGGSVADPGEPRSEVIWPVQNAGDRD